nr:hypothetical protein [Sedimentibacter sp.]
MNIIETKIKIEEVNKLLISYDELDFNKIRETKKKIVSIWSTDTDEEIKSEGNKDKLNENIGRYIEDDSNLDEYIKYDYIETWLEFKNAFIEKDKLTEFTNQLLYDCNTDKILILMANTIKCNFITIDKYSQKWLDKLEYLDTNCDLILNVPKQIIKEIINTIVNYKIENTVENKESDEIHDLLIEMINEVENDMKIYEVKKIAFWKRNNLLTPKLSYRTSELLDYMYIKTNKDIKRLVAVKLLEECFSQCTRTVVYYINLYDLKAIIYRHKEEKIWCIQLANIAKAALF